MILNTYAVLDAFLTLLRLGFALLVVTVAVRAWYSGRCSQSPADTGALEDRRYLVILLAAVLLGLSVASWPLFYLLLQSYVPQWPGVMCIYGVTQVGSGSRGLSRFLPDLVAGLELIKPALVFASGAWLVLYLVDRRTTTAPLRNRVLGVIVLVGLLAAADAAAEGAYLVIPKKEDFLAAGCCSEAFDAEARATRFVPRALLGEEYRPYVTSAYWGANAGMILALAGSAVLARRSRRLAFLGPLLVGALVTLAVSAVFLVEVAAPALLHKPYHHCPYDLLPQVPESVAGIALFVLGSFCVGWACVVGWLANTAQTRALVRRSVRALLALGCFAYLAALVLMAVELALV
jgi:hypothetical protein